MIAPNHIPQVISAMQDAETGMLVKHDLCRKYAVFATELRTFATPEGSFPYAASMVSDGITTPGCSPVTDLLRCEYELCMNSDACATKSVRIPTGFRQISPSSHPSDAAMRNDLFPLLKGKYGEVPACPVRYLDGRVELRLISLFVRGRLRGSYLTAS